MKLSKLIRNIEDEVKEVWHSIHENPELSMEEYKTAELIEKKLKEIKNLDEIKRVGQTGICAKLVGTKEVKGLKRKTIALRGDMDALPIQEETGLPYASKVPNVMHACGHDLHASLLLGAAKVLSEYKDEIPGSVLFFFQPAEETLQGAKLFLEDETIDFGHIDGIAALHCSPELDAGTIGIRKGAMLASANKLTIRVMGKQGHAAHPHTAIDSIVIASNIVVALQTLVSREIAAYDSAVLSFGTINGGIASNIIANEVVLEGTLRALSFETRDKLQKSLVRVCKNVAAALGGDCQVEIEDGPPPLICDEEWVDRAHRVGGKVLGQDNVISMTQPSMGAEDFAFMKEKVPGVFIRLGSRTPNGPYGSIHSPHFYNDENALYTGIHVMGGIVLDFFDIEY